MRVRRASDHVDHPGEKTGLVADVAIGAEAALPDEFATVFEQQVRRSGWGVRSLRLFRRRGTGQQKQEDDYQSTNVQAHGWLTCQKTLNHLEIPKKNEFTTLG